MKLENLFPSRFSVTFMLDTSNKSFASPSLTHLPNGVIAIFRASGKAVEIYPVRLSLSTQSLVLPVFALS